MECMNQFQLYVNHLETFTTGSNYSSWTSGTNINWTVATALPANNFKIGGFKNINLYGIKTSLLLRNRTDLAAKGIINDYNLKITYTGQVPTVSGFFSINTLGLVTGQKEIILGKYNNEIMFKDPIKSCGDISIADLFADGYNPENLTSLTLLLSGQIIFYYKYEGENE